MSGRSTDWLLWKILHLVFALLCALEALFMRMRMFILSFTSDASNVEKVSSSRPLTVAVVLEPQEAVDNDGKIPQLLLWLSMANVAHITLYDAGGKLKRSKEQLQRALDSFETEDPSTRSKSEAEMLSKFNRSRRLWEVQSHNDEDVLDQKCELDSNDAGGNDVKRRKASDSVKQEGIRSQEAVGVRHIVVELLSLQDGKEALVRAARHVCENAYKIHYAEQSTKKTKLTEDDINKSLQATGGDGPDPDLLLLFGVTRSLLGFPPWRLRLTEIVHMGSMKDLTLHSFVNALKDFSKKTQRYGK